MSENSMTPMTLKTRAVVLLLVQAALVLSIAGKYVYERKKCPRVWVRTAQFDPNMPLRGRYLALQLAVDACGLPRVKAEHQGAIAGSNPPDLGYDRWTVRTRAENGKLLAVPAVDTDRPEETAELTLWANRPCDRATLSKSVEYFIADEAKSPLPLKPHQELWVEVTVPPVGPPRPIQLAVAEGGVFSPWSGK